MSDFFTTTYRSMPAFYGADLRRLLTAYEWTLLTCIADLTFGHRKLEDRISGGQMESETGMSASAVNAALKALLHFHIIRQLDKGSPLEKISPLYQVHMERSLVDLVGLRERNAAKIQANIKRTTKARNAAKSAETNKKRSLTMKTSLKSVRQTQEKSPSLSDRHTIDRANNIVIVEGLSNRRDGSNTSYNSRQPVNDDNNHELKDSAVVNGWSELEAGEELADFDEAGDELGDEDEELDEFDSEDFNAEDFDPKASNGYSTKILSEDSLPEDYHAANSALSSKFDPDLEAERAALEARLKETGEN